jgi:hypothetical protein
MYKRQYPQAHRPTHDNCDLSRNISWRIRRLESLRPDDVARAVADEVHGSDGGLFRVARDVGGDEREEGDEGRGTGLREVVACEAAAVGVQGERDDEDLNVKVRSQ